MRTYTHGAVGYLLYRNRPRSERWLAATGAVLPDTLLAVGFVFHVAEPLTRAAIVADLHALFHFSPLHTVTIALHSFLVVGPLLLGALLAYRRMVPLVVGMLSHGVIDLVTHRGSAYNHLFPLPLSPIRGPVDYTSVTFTVVEHVAFLVVVLWMLRTRRPGRSAA